MQDTGGRISPVPVVWGSLARRRSVLRSARLTVP